MTRWTACAFALSLSLCAPTLARAAPVAPINAVVGDASWVERHGRAPTSEDELLRDEERHQVHLAWIEARLRERPVGHLSEPQRSMRAFLLDALAEYRARGVHPLNERTERRPRFLDRDGRICAVGFMIEVTAGRKLVERINDRWEYDYLLEIRDPALEAWIEASGFTPRELASIQPTGYVGIGVPSLGDGEAWLAGIGAALLLGADVAFVAVDFSRGDRLGDGLATTQLVFGGLQLVGAAISLGVASEMSGESDWRSPLYAGAVLAGGFGLFHIIYAAMALAEPEPRRPMEVAFSPAPGGGVLSLHGVL